MTGVLAQVVSEISGCRICRDAPKYGSPLPHEPRPVVQAGPGARICIAGQAPGARVHASGRPYTDQSGVRLRSWMGVGDDAFYDSGLVAVVPMGFCFPGTDAKGGDLPPRRECAEVWRVRVMGALPDVELLILIGQYAQRWHLGSEAMRGGVTQTVRAWRAIYCPEARPRVLPLPHPSWRNNGWLRKNDWFEADLLPVLRAEVSRALAGREADLKTPPSTR